MLTIDNYIKPENLTEAFLYLKRNRSNSILGGGCYLRLGNRNITNAIELSHLGLDYIKESAGEIEIGAMTTLREIEKSEILNSYFNGVLARSVEHIVGTQIRNSITIGGAVFSKHGFSDILTALLALDAKIHFVGAGVLSLSEYTKRKPFKDIIEKITIEKSDLKAGFTSFRKTEGDYPILNAAVSNKDGKILISVGAAPSRAKIAIEASCLASEKADINEILNSIQKDIIFGTNLYASKEYREKLSRVLVKRLLTEVGYDF